MLPSSLSWFALSLTIVACGGSTADPPGSGTLPAAGATSTAPTSPTPTPTPSPTASPTATPTTMPTVTPPPATTCNALINAGPQVTAMQVASDAPAAVGGAVVDGTYHLTDLTIYTGAGGKAGALPLALKQTIAIHGTTADAVTDVSGMVQAQSTTFLTSGTTATTAGTCPKAEPPQTGEYSATPTSLVLFLVNDQGKTTRYTYAP